MRTFLLFLLFGCLLPFAGKTQPGLSGQVLSSDNKTPVASANVYIANSSTGTITDEKGNFLIRNFPAGRYDLVISCIGFETKVITISSAQISSPLNILLKPRVNELQEVIVAPYEKNGWEKWGGFFLENFIGTSAFAQDCKLKNHETVKFHLDKKRNVLQVTAYDRLIIENKALGYIVKYDLAGFEYDFNTHILLFQGYPLFEEMESKRNAANKRWAKNREDAYYGSVMHFMRSLYRNTLQQEHFEVRRLIKISNAEKNRVRNLYRVQFINDAIEGKTITADGQLPALRRDTAAYYHKVMNDPESLNILINKVLTGDSIAYALDSVNVGLEFVNYLQVVYPLKKTPPEYQKFLPKGVTSIPLTSEMFRVNANVIVVQANGNYFEGTDLITSGYWGWSEKMAALLPIDYWPAPKK